MWEKFFGQPDCLHVRSNLVPGLTYHRLVEKMYLQAWQRAIKQLKRFDNIVITKPDKGTGVVVMNKSNYVSRLSQVSINHTSKVTPVSLQRPKMKG